MRAAGVLPGGGLWHHWLDGTLGSATTAPAAALLASGQDGGVLRILGSRSLRGETPLAQEPEDFVAAQGSASLAACGISRTRAISGSLKAWASSSPLGLGQIMSSWKSMVPCVRHGAPNLSDLCWQTQLVHRQMSHTTGTRPRMTVQFQGVGSKMCTALCSKNTTKAQ